MTGNYYFILGLDKFASISEVKSAYRRMAKKYHPDIDPSNPQNEEKFKRVLEAYQTLSDPDKKYNYDQSLIKPDHKPTARYSSSPNYSPPPYYSTKKPEYTPKAWMLGKIFIIVLIMSVVLIPIYLLHQSSVRYYELGMEYYKQGDLYSALNNLNKSITNFGGRSVEGAIKAAEIYIYKLNDHQGAISTINKGLEHAETIKDKATLIYLRGVGYYGNQEAEKALNDINLADSLGYNQDSITMNLAFISAFALNEFHEGKEHFEKLIERGIKLETSWFGKAWCQQQLNEWKGAKSSYSQVILLNEQNALAYSYRARVALNLHDSLAACNDFKKAFDLGDYRAENYIEYFCEQ